MLDNKILDKINYPEDLRSFDKSDLQQITDELREFVIDTVSFTGGHLGAGLGVIELTIAIHYIFNTPEDNLIWDVGHQAYPHKILTGRKDRIRTLRKGDGLSGFTKRCESEYDDFGAGHSSTSISAGLGMAVADKLDQKDNKTIAVIGDGAMSAGQAYEAMNNAGAMKSKNLIVVLNDNDMSIAPPVGALSAHLSRIISSKQYRNMREFGKKLSNKMPDAIKVAAKRSEEYARGMLTGGTLFEELDFYYVGPIDGHNLNHLLPVLENLRDMEQSSPILLHVVTQKGKGYKPAEDAIDKMHGVGKFDVITGAQVKAKSNAPSYTAIFSESIIQEAAKDDKIVTITAAMPDGTGLKKFKELYPDRFFDVGIAEQHAVTFAAGMACKGYKPFVAIYSTFLQRAYDQIVHDVAIQNLPVRFAIDRAGLVGADGQTHAGSFDISYLGALPNFILMAAADEAELKHMVATQVAIDNMPSALRYPRGEGVGVEIPEIGQALEIGKGRILKSGDKIALLSYGTRLKETLMAAENLEALGLSTTVADARFAKPLDQDLIKELVLNHQILITIEEGSVGGFGSFVLNYLMEDDLLNTNCQIKNMVLPDIFIDHNDPAKQYKSAKLDADNIVKMVNDILAKQSLVEAV